MNTTPLFRADDIALFHSDCITLMDGLVEEHPDGMFDMIFADPPYFLSNGGISCQAGKMVRVDKGGWDKSAGVEANHTFNMAWLLRCQKLLKANGTIWVSGTHHVIHSIGHAMQCLNMKLLNSITWEKPNPPPNLSCRYFTHSTETILWASKSEKSKHCFNYQFMKAQNGGKQMKSVWRICAPGKAEKLWGKHPTQKPVELLDRIVLASTERDDLVFDPFSGSGTTGVSAIRNGRKFLGCDSEEKYIDLSVLRLSRESESIQKLQRITG